jgi:ATP-binding cassette subfamily B protein
MLKRFVRFYKPHMRLFTLDMSFAFLSSILSILFPALTRKLLRDIIPAKDFDAMITIVSIMIAIIVFKTISMYIRVKWGHYLGVRMEYDMRNKIFRHIQKLSFSYFDNVKTGHIMSRISNDLNMIAEVAHHAPEDLIISTFILAGSFYAMFAFNSKLALITLIPLPILVLWGLTYGRKMKSGFRKVRKRIADINSSVENSVQGIREVKSYANEDLEQVKFDFVNTRFKSAKENMYGIMATFHSGMSFLTDLYYLIVIGYGAYLIFNNQLILADLIAFTLYVNFILNPITRLINFTEQFQQGSAAFERFVEIMDINPDIEDSKDAKDLMNIDGNIEFKNVDFMYSSSNNLILKDINIKVKKGERIAIVGESGAGKSTLISLIARFYDTLNGKILIDGKEIKKLTQKSLRENIGIVRQSVFLFDSTIKDNILYGNPEATDEEIIQAAKNANIWDFIESLPDGLNTLIGERGVKLSGGQKQRISIARVFLKNPPILIFDEATSSLDTTSEKYIQEAMDRLSVNRTTLIIAHRLSTVKNADRIYVLKDGLVVEEGTHEELITKHAYYHKLYTGNTVIA